MEWTQALGEFGRIHAGLNEEQVAQVAANELLIHPGEPPVFLTRRGKRPRGSVGFEVQGGFLVPDLKPGMLPFRRDVIYVDDSFWTRAMCFVRLPEGWTLRLLPKTFGFSLPGKAKRPGSKHWSVSGDLPDDKVAGLVDALCRLEPEHFQEYRLELMALDEVEEGGPTHEVILQTDTLAYEWQGSGAMRRYHTTFGSMIRLVEEFARILRE